MDSAGAFTRAQNGQKLGAQKHSCREKVLVTNTTIFKRQGLSLVFKAVNPHQSRLW